MDQRAEPQALTARTRLLDITYEQYGPVEGPPVILLHGFPDNVRAWDAVAPSLARKGYRAIVPYLRGFGPTRFLDASTLRVGQQAALGLDVIDLMDALALPKAALAGYDWGNTAACVASILRPDRVRALLSIHGYGVWGMGHPDSGGAGAGPGGAGVLVPLVLSHGARTEGAGGKPQGNLSPAVALVVAQLEVPEADF